MEHQGVKGKDTMRHSAGVRLCLRFSTVVDVASPSRCSLDCEVKMRRDALSRLLMIGSFPHMIQSVSEPYIEKAWGIRHVQRG